jgi:UDP-N-acetylmuramoyl-tripeptide--D-alanyl-D-alanine ligase
MSPAFEWSDAAVRRALELPGAADAVHVRVCTDTRSAEKGDLFVALNGPNFDGHDFLEAAAAAGASGAVVSHDVPVPSGMVQYHVDDTLVALGRLARFRRDALPAQVVAITGSSGKTSTKDFTRAALAETFRVHATTGNLNNRVGVPLTLLEAPAEAQVLVVELGTSEPGEIAALTAMTRPDVAAVITVSESHLDQLVDLEGVVREKLDLLRGLEPGAVGVVGDVPDFLPERARKILRDVRVAGLTDSADPDLRPSRLTVDSAGRYGFRWQGAEIRMEVAGRHMAYNAVLALALARILGVPAEAAARGVSSVSTTTMRGEIVEAGPLSVVVDCYNANPQSTRAALDTLASRAGEGRRIAFLGTMLELGTGSDTLHGEVLDYALDRGLDLVVATGDFADALPDLKDPRLVRFADPEAAYQRVLPILREGGTLLLKASRGVRLERILPRLEEDLSGAGVHGGGGEG